VVVTFFTDRSSNVVVITIFDDVKLRISIVGVTRSTCNLCTSPTIFIVIKRFECILTIYTFNVKLIVVSNLR
jgi:hypothetical protein